MEGGKTWADQVLDYFAAGPGIGIDPTLIAAQLARTPTERLEYLRSVASQLEEMRREAEAARPRAPRQPDAS